MSGVGRWAISIAPFFYVDFDRVMQKRERILAFLIALLALSGLAAGYRATLTPVTLVIDGEEHVMRTHQPTVGLLLSDLGISLRTEDWIAPALETALEPDLTIEIDRAEPVVLIVDGQERMLLVHDESPADVLAEAGVELGPHDTLEVRSPVVSDPTLTRFRIVVKRAVPVILEEGSVRTSLFSDAHTVGEALLQAGVYLYRADRVYPDPATPLQSGMHIRLERSIPVVARVDGHTLRTRTHRYRVGEVLADLGIALSGQDYTEPELDAPLGDGLEIRVVRVTESVLVEQSPIPFDTVWQSDSEMEIDTQGLLQEGAPGVLERRIRLRYENNEVVNRRVEGESVVLPPTHRIMGYGTNIIVRQLATDSGVIEYWRVIRMLATSYSASTAGTPATSPWYGRTATGMTMRHGIVAIDPRLVPLRSQVYVPGYGVGIAGDTGGAIKGRRIDLGYDDDNLRLWYSWVDVYLLTPVPSADKINFVLP